MFFKKMFIAKFYSYFLKKFQEFTLFETFKIINQHINAKS